MKALYQCDFCGRQGVEDFIREHEKMCVMDKSKRNCYTCKNNRSFITQVHCDAGKEPAKDTYFQHCDCWEDNGVDYANTSFDNILTGLFGGR